MAVAFQSSATAQAFASSLAPSKPSGTASGDVLYAVLTDWSGSGITITAPSGWTLISAASGNDGAPQNIGQHVYRLVAGASEPATYTWSWGSNEDAAVVIRRYTGQGTTPEDVSSFHCVDSVASPSTSSLTTTVANDMALVAFGAASYTAASETLSTPSGFANAVSQQVTANNQAVQLTCDETLGAAGTFASQSTTPSPALGGTWGTAGSAVTIQPAVVVVPWTPARELYPPYQVL